MKVVLLIALLSVSGCDGRRVVGQTGQNVTLPCKYDRKYGAVHVCWGREELPSSKCNNQLLSTDGYKVLEETRASSRYQLLGRLDQGDVSLTILNLREEDAGRYGCRAEIPGWFNDEKHHVDLTVERAPTSWAPSEPQTSSERPAATQTAADQLTTESLLTSSSNSSIFTVAQQQENNMLTMVLVLVLFLLVVLLTAAGLFIMARRWKQLKLPPQQPRHQVQFSSTSSTLHLHQRASAVENVYQIDGVANGGGDYEFFP